MLMFTSLPLLIYLLGLSLQDAAGFERALDILQTHWLLATSVILAWSVFHHLFSGIRFLFIDMGIGVGLLQARRSAWLVSSAGLLATLAYVWWLL